jgi:hypothetical protein
MARVSALFYEYGSDGMPLVVSEKLPVGVADALNVAVPKWDLQCEWNKILWKTHVKVCKLLAKLNFCCAKLLFQFNIAFRDLQ